MSCRSSLGCHRMKRNSHWEYKEELLFQAGLKIFLLYLAENKDNLFTAPHAPDKWAAAQHVQAR